MLQSKAQAEGLWGEFSKIHTQGVQFARDAFDRTFDTKVSELDWQMQKLLLSTRKGSSSFPLEGPPIETSKAAQALLRWTEANPFKNPQAVERARSRALLVGRLVP